MCSTMTNSPAPGPAWRRILATGAAFVALVAGGIPSRAADGAAAPRCFVEEGGLLVIEAEHFAEREPSTFPAYAEPHAWVERDDDPAASGGRYLEVLPDERGEDGEGPASPRDRSGAALRCAIRVTTPGTYHVFVRGKCRGGESNGVHLGLNGELAGRGPGASNISGFRPKEAWNWETRRKHGHEGTAVLVLTPGTHVLNIWSRDDGFRLDKIVLSLLPEPPRDLGPAESSAEPMPPARGTNSSL